MKPTLKVRILTSAFALAALLAAVPGAAGAPADETKPSPLLTALKNLKLSGYAQVLGTVWHDDTDTFQARRVRLTLAGEIVKNLRFKVTADIVKSPALLDGLVEFEPARFAGLRIGQFLVPFSLESTTSTSDIDFVNRAVMVDTLSPGRDIGSSGRDAGAAVFGRYSILEYTAGFFNGSAINKADTNSHKDFAGRLVLRPFGILAVGGSIYRGRQNPAPDAPDPALLKRDREGFDAVVLLGGFSAKGEWLHAVDDLVSKAGWYAQAGYFALPARLQGLVRYESLDLDRAVPGNTHRIFTAGVNWFIAGKTKLQVNYELHKLQGEGTEKSGVLAQLQAAF